MSPANRPPKAVVLACIQRKVDLADVFCWEIENGEVVLHMSGRGVIRVPLEELPEVPRPGPPPVDTRAQPGPGKAATARRSSTPPPCDEVDAARPPSPAADDEPPAAAA